MDRELWKKAADFHGHECGGLALGVRAAAEALERFGVNREADERLVCVSENDACGVDGIQAILGCTIGKGNLLYYGTGKMAFNFYDRKTGDSFRMLAKPKEEMRVSGSYIEFVLEGPLEEIFTVGETRYALPEKARRMDTVICQVCGEGAPDVKMRIQNGKTVCLECFREYDRGW